MTDPTAASTTPADQPFPTYEPPTADGAGSEPVAPATPVAAPTVPVTAQSSWRRRVGSATPSTSSSAST